MKKTRFFWLVIAFVMLLSACGRVDYDMANKKCTDMKDYSMDISTIVTIENGEDVKQSAISQKINVNNKGKADMIYSVQSVATATLVTEGESKVEENSYVFYKDSYYYTYPGVRYKSPVTHDMALSNIENLSNVITFSEDEMIDAVWEKVDGESIVSFQVDYADTSAFVQGLLENAAATVDAVSFSPKEMGASCTVKSGTITAREIYIGYEAVTGESITVEIYVSYGDAQKVEKPDESKYVDIMAK